MREKVAEVKPRLRGMLHAAITPLALAAGSRPDRAVPHAQDAGRIRRLRRYGAAVVRGLGDLPPRQLVTRVWALLRRIDHSNIFLLIAGSYTPFTLILLDGKDRVVLLVLVWSGAVLGAVFRILWSDAPRWLYVPIYVAMGWAAIFYADQFSSRGPPAVIVLIAVGGCLYTLGGVVYGLKRPNPFPQWFGFHEVFHSFVVAAFICHYVAASIATYSLR